MDIPILSCWCIVTGTCQRNSQSFIRSSTTNSCHASCHVVRSFRRSNILHQWHRPHFLQFDLSCIKFHLSCTTITTRVLKKRYNHWMEKTVYERMGCIMKKSGFYVAVKAGFKDSINGKALKRKYALDFDYLENGELSIVNRRI